MADRWVNARIEVVIPMLAVGTAASKAEKQEALSAVMEDLSDRIDDQDWLLSGRWEDVEDGEPLAHERSRT